ncbi:prominin-like protein [Drosophila novamexicana]|uniref:prominin-like protein n=1 Tax=Drosophila novamexicana TaxID=47314 RepID=UPI0011E5EBFB|nr:prominin-like protein [Drosophila novamexicana]XP_030565625.1 prominin-like protein [Drosophila novamexicana]XP_030565626.1 prominin-like protein [Drosophila novamexicana]
MKKVNWLIQCLVACTSMAFVACAEDVVWREGYQGHGTVHEQLGQPHVPDPMFSEYVPKTRHRNITKVSHMSLGPVNVIANGLLHLFYRPGKMQLSDYITVSNGSTLTIERKMKSNDWKSLLAANKLLILWLLFFLLLILVIPILGILYCSLCWCRCKRGCPPCTSQRDAKLRVVFSVIMVILLIGLIIGTIIAFIANKQISRGVRSAKESLLSSGEGICAFLKGISDHIDHLVITNYQELKEHLVEQATDAYKHLFLDLADTSDGNALVDLERVLQNMREARARMKSNIWNVDRLVFLVANFRDAMRYYYRETYRGFIILCQRPQCDEKMISFGFQSWVTKCMHLDGLPNSTKFWGAMDKSVKLNLENIPRLGIKRLWEVGENLKKIMDPTIPPLIARLDRCGDLLIQQREDLKKIIDEMLHNANDKTINSAKSLDNILTNFGTDRTAINIIVCITLMLIIVMLIIGLVWGMCVRANNLGSGAMLVSVLLIFCVFSFITIVGLFYFMLGFLTYNAACRSTITTTNSFMDSRINAPVADEEQDRNAMNTTTTTISKNVFDCKRNGTFFDLLKEKGLYDVMKLKGMLQIDEAENEFKWHSFKGDLSQMALITHRELRLLYKVLQPLFFYRSRLYTDVLCLPMTRTSLQDMDDLVTKTGFSLIYNFFKGRTDYSRMWMSSCSYFTVSRDIQPFKEVEAEIPKYVNKIKSNLEVIDRLILSENLDFNETFQPMIEAIIRAQEFINYKGVEFIENLGKNLTGSISDQLDNYVKMIIYELTLHVGPCKHLSDLYTNSLEHVCQHLIDPINAFWLGVLLSALLLLPILYVAHRLICLYRVYPVYVAKILYLERDGYPCPTCSGLPYRPNPVIICGGGQQDGGDCPCIDTPIQISGLGTTTGNAYKSKRE